MKPATGHYNCSSVCDSTNNHRKCQMQGCPNKTYMCGLRYCIYHLCIHPNCINCKDTNEDISEVIGDGGKTRMCKKQQHTLCPQVFQQSVSFAEEHTCECFFGGTIERTFFCNLHKCSKPDCNLHRYTIRTGGTENSFYCSNHRCSNDSCLNDRSCTKHRQA
jgi:hypothetical protein